MTNKKAIEIIKAECYVADLLNLDRTRMINTALDMATKALEHEEIGGNEHGDLGTGSI